jgi:hypothetical protein
VGARYAVKRCCTAAPSLRFATFESEAEAEAEAWLLQQHQDVA